MATALDTKHKTMSFRLPSSVLITSSEGLSTALVNSDRIFFRWRRKMKLVKYSGLKFEKNSDRIRASLIVGKECVRICSSLFSVI